MQDTTFRQLTLPPLALGTNDTVNAVATAPPDKPMRLLIRNQSAATCFFGASSESMVGPGAPGTDVFELDPGDDVIFVLAPKQKLYGCANAIGATISISMSEALPVL